MRRFIRDVASLVHARTTHLVTVGSASLSTLPLVTRLGLDFYQVHWYDRQRDAFGLEQPVRHLGLDEPVLLGEFPTRGSARTPPAIIAAARASGYAGAFGWSVASDDPQSDGGALRAGILCSNAGAGDRGIGANSSADPGSPVPTNVE